LVIIATPVMSIRGILEQIANNLSPGCVVTDTASTKVQVMKWAEEYLPPEVSFIGGHPMAGKERAGIEAADDKLFHNCTYCLVKSSSATLKGVRLVVELVEQMEANPLFIDAAEHDNLVAGISHLPTLLSSALVLTTTKSAAWPQMSKLAAGGYRDLTRLASGNVEMNRDICQTNSQNIVRWIDNFIAEMSELRRLLTKDGEELERALTKAQKARKKWFLDGKNSGRDKET
jgi:prephenate dehydrogenase